MNRVATNEDPVVVSVPEVVRMTIVAVQPATVIIVFDVPDVQIAVRVRSV